MARSLMATCQSSIRIDLTREHLLLMACIPQLGGDEDLFSLDNAFVNSSPYTVASFFFVSVIVSAIEQSVTRLDGLEIRDQHHCSDNLGLYV